MIKGRLSSKHRKEIENFMNPFTASSGEFSTIKKLFLPSLLILLLIGVFFLKPAIIGYVIEQNSMEYRIEVNKTFSNSDTYIFDIGTKGILTSLGISGEVIGNGTVKI